MRRSGGTFRTPPALAVLVVCAAAAATTPAARAARAGHARVELLPESASIPPAGATSLGIRFTIDPGWHIYWRNPGESGGAPAIAWTTAPALTIGELEWPTPTRFDAPADTTYGYQGIVILLATARAAEASPSAAFDVRARVDYQICKDVCVKETATPNTTVTVGPPAAPLNPDVFEKARAALPIPMPPAWTASASVGPQEWLLEIDTGRAESAGMFFPYQPDLIDDSAAQRVDSRPTGLSLHLRKSRTFSTPPATLDGLLVRPGERAVEIRAAVR